MANDIYKYQCAAETSMDDVERLILQAVMATESIHGTSQTRLDVSHALDAEKRSVVVDATTIVGRDFNRLFIGYLEREFGPDSFSVERVVA